MVRICVCKGCGLSNDKIRRELKHLWLKHGAALEIEKVDCLDACKKDPAVRVGKKLLAPASPKKLRRAVKKMVATEAAGE